MKKIIDFNIIKSETESFIKKAKEKSVSNGKYNVYAIKFTVDRKGYCITHGYTSSPLHVSDLNKFRYYFYLNDELVLVDYPSVMKQKYELMNNCLNLITDRKIIDKRIAPEPFLGISCGSVCCYYDREVIKTFYDNDENVPLGKAIVIYKHNEGTLIEMDSTTFKKTLNESGNR